MELNRKLIILTLRLIRRYKFLEQEMTNYSLQANSSPLLILVNEALLEYSSFAIDFHITYDCFCNTIAELNSCNGDRMIYKAKTFIIWWFTKMFVNCCLIQSFGQSHYLHKYFFGGRKYLVGRVVMICFFPCLFHFTTKSSSFYRTSTSQGQNKNNNNKKGHRYHSVITDSCSHCGFPACPDSLSLNICFPFLVA